MITLATAKEAFDAWRQTKSNANTPVPVKLWKMVEVLLPTTQKTLVCKTLGINIRQIQYHCPAALAPVKANIPIAPKVSDFVEAMPSPSSPSVTQSERVELTLQGESKSFRLSFPVTLLRDVLSTVGGML